jgi:hypothetical protein
VLAEQRLCNGPSKDDGEPGSGSSRRRHLPQRAYDSFSEDIAETYHLVRIFELAGGQFDQKSPQTNCLRPHRTWPSTSMNSASRSKLLTRRAK